MQRSRHFTLRHAVHPFATNAPALPLVTNRDSRDSSGTDLNASTRFEGLKLLLDIVLLFGATLFIGWAVGGVVAKLLVDLVTR